MFKIYYSFFILILIASVLTIISLFVTSGVFLLNSDPKAIDFVAFYTGAFSLDRNPQMLYYLPQQLIIQQQIAPITQHVPIFLPFLNPPFVALFFTPFVPLGLQNSYALWVIVNVCIVIVLCIFGIRELKKYRLYQKVLFVLGTITFIPLLTSLLLGQLSLILCLVLLSSWLLLKQKKEYQSGLVLSLLLIKPHLILIPLLVIVVQRKKAMIAGLLSGIIILTSISFFLVGATGMSDYFALLQSATQWNAGYGIDVMAQHSLQTVLLILFQTRNLAEIRLVWIVFLLILILPTAFLWSRKVVFSALHRSLKWALLIVVMLLTSPHTHFHDLSFLIIVAIIVLSVFPQMKLQQRQRYVFLFVLGYLIMLFGYLVDLSSQTYFNQSWIVISVSFLLIFWMNLSYDLFHQRNDKV